MAVALEMLVGTYARSVKEASTYASLIAIVGFMPALFLSVLPIRPPPRMYYIPTVGQLYFINDTARGLPLNWAQVILCSAITLGIGIAALVAAIRFYNKERILLGTATA